MQSHQLVLLSQIRQCFEQFTCATTQSLVKFLVDEGKQSIILNGIYRQLYYDGDSNQIQFLQSLLSQSKQFIQSQSSTNDTSINAITNDNHFKRLPDSLMCEIGSYLSSKEILTKWNIVNRKFLEIGYKPETHTKWDFSYKSEANIEIDPPKFRINTLVSKLKIMKYNSDFSSLFNLSDAKNAQSVAIGMNYAASRVFSFFLFVSCHVTLIIIHDNDNVYIGYDKYDEDYEDMYLDVKVLNLLPHAKNISFHLFNETHFCDIFWGMDRIDGEKIIANDKNSKYVNQVKSIKLHSIYVEPTTWSGDTRNFNDPARIANEQEDIEHYTKLLDVLLPLSPQERELKKRLKTEITDEMRKNKTLLEIEKLENKIKNEIELHYNTFDENELSYDECSGNMVNGRNKVLWHSPLEMIALDGLEISSPSAHVISKLQLESRLNSSRIQATLGNLKCLQLHNSNTNFCCRITMNLLNSIANQLTSLHIDHYQQLHAWQWEFVKTDPCALLAKSKSAKENDINSASWYPVNVRELCIDDRCADTTASNFWNKYINNQSFPNLKRLKIIDCIGEKVCQILGVNSDSNKSLSVNTMTNISSLIKNNIELIYFSITRLEYCDFIVGLDKEKYGIRSGGETIDPCKIIQFWQKLLDCYAMDNKNDDNINVRKISVPFVLKLELDVRWRSSIGVFDCYLRSKIAHKMEAKLTNLMDQVGLLFINMNTRLKSDVMLAFKIKFHVEQNEDEGYNYSDLLKRVLDECVKNRMLLSSDDTRIVDTNAHQYQTNNDCDDGKKEMIVVFGVVFKNKDKGKSNNTCQLCYTEPQFEYQCSYCQSECCVT